MRRGSVKRAHDLGKHGYGELILQARKEITYCQRYKPEKEG
jgi:hypothetical protein